MHAANAKTTVSSAQSTLTGDYTVIYTKSKDANNYISSDGGKTLEIIRFISLATRRARSKREDHSKQCAKHRCNKFFPHFTLRPLFIFFSLNAGYSDCDIWFWYSGADGKGYVLHPCEYGAKMIVNVPESVTEVNYIIRTGVSEPLLTAEPSLSAILTCVASCISAREINLIISSVFFC